MRRFLVGSVLLVVFALLATSVFAAQIAIIYAFQVYGWHGGGAVAVSLMLACAPCIGRAMLAIERRLEAA